ncbi:MAG TPA: response regulator [Gammaproteobacteria bacterium]|nr:response regulator [Gammaproteobacteria bacterium]
MSTVLIVDDSPTEVHVFKGWLEKQGHQVITAENGQDGIATAKAEKPDAIIMDVVMPGMSGFQATRQLSRDAETSGIPVLIVTTKDQETDKIWGMRQGAVDYLVKPIDEDQLIGKLKEAIGGQ